MEINVDTNRSFGKSMPIGLGSTVFDRLVVPYHYRRLFIPESRLQEQLLE